MTIQDAIDFAVGMIQITATIQKCTAGRYSKRSDTIDASNHARLTARASHNKFPLE
jgi:hypothetical protein